MITDTVSLHHHFSYIQCTRNSVSRKWCKTTNRFNHFMKCNIVFTSYSQWQGLLLVFEILRHLHDICFIPLLGKGFFCTISNLLTMTYMSLYMSICDFMLVLNSIQRWSTNFILFFKTHKVLYILQIYK